MDTRTCPAIPIRIVSAPTPDLRSILGCLPDAIVMVNPCGRIEHVNALTEKMFGYESGELLGQSIDALLPERFRRVHADHCADYFARPHARAMGVGLNLQAQRKDGAEFPIAPSVPSGPGNRRRARGDRDA